jgi:hypothetical protein
MNLIRKSIYRELMQHVPLKVTSRKNAAICDYFHTQFVSDERLHLGVLPSLYCFF